MSVIELTNSNYAKEVEEASTPIIVDFFANWCGPCQMLSPVFEKLSHEYKGKLRFGKVNTENYPQLAGKFDITGIPCLVLVKHGKEVDRIVGFLPKEALKEKIDSILQNI